MMILIIKDVILNLKFRKKYKIKHIDGNIRALMTS